MIIHITEAIEGLILSSKSNTVYQMRSACEQPAPLVPGFAVDEL